MTELPKDEFSIETFAADNVDYAVVTFTDCEVGEYVGLPKSILAKISEGDRLEVVSEVTGKPVMDIDGDRFPEFSGYMPYGGGGHHFLSSALKDNKTVATEACY